MDPDLARRPLCLFSDSRTVRRGPRPTVLQRPETRLPDGFPVTRLVLPEQAVAHQKADATLTYLDRRDQDHTP